MREDGHGARLYLREEMEKPDSIAAGGGSVMLLSVPRPGEGANEDACAVLPYEDGTAALVVSDGAGGMREGGEAARRTVSALHRSFTRGREAGLPLRAAVLDGIEAANRAVQELGGGAATVAVAEVDGKGVRPYHVGDSTILLVGGRGRVKHQSMPHSPVGYAVEAGVLSESEAMHHDDRHVVSNVVGSAEMHIEVGPRIALAPRDTLLLASDGLADNMYLDEIVQIIRRGRLDAAVGRLIEQCRRRMEEPASGEPSKPDDLTVLVYRPAAG